MKSAEFDKFADEYYSLHAKNISVSGEKPEYFAEYKVRDIRSVCAAARDPSTELAILDFGSGVGTSVPFIRHYFAKARITCIDVSEKSLSIGRVRFAGQAEFKEFDGQTIPFVDASFDLVFAACVFHHIDASEHVNLLAEFFRVLKPGGAAIVYEHNPLNPLTRRAVIGCPFDENAELIAAPVMKQRFCDAGFANPVLRYRVFFPAFARALRCLEPSLAGLPLGAQYYVAAYK